MAPAIANMTVMVGKRSRTPLLAGWTFKQVGSDNEPLPVAQMPTNIHLDLMYHEIIPDPSIGTNETDVQWVGEEDWAYYAKFSSPKLVNGEKAVLVFEGLDTFATVVLNGKQILETDNMFILERVDVTHVLRPKGDENELVITFESAFLRGKRIQEQHPNHKWGCWNGDSSRLGVRKAQYHYVSAFHYWRRWSSDHERDGIGLQYFLPVGHGDQLSLRRTTLGSPTFFSISALMVR